MLVTPHLALRSLLFSSGPGCSGSWPVWTRRSLFSTAVAYAWLVLLVMLFALCFLLLTSDPDARHLGRYGPEGQVCSLRVWPRSSSNAAEACCGLVLLVTISLLYFLLFVVGRTGMLGILVGMDQKVFSCFPVVHMPIVCVDRCHGYGVHKTSGIFAVAVFQVVDTPFVTQRCNPMVWRFPSYAWKRWSMALFCSRAVFCRDAEAVPHGLDCLSDHRDSPVASHGV